MIQNLIAANQKQAEFAQSQKQIINQTQHKQLSFNAIQLSKSLELISNQTDWNAQFEKLFERVSDIFNKIGDQKLQRTLSMLMNFWQQNKFNEVKAKPPQKSIVSAQSIENKQVKIQIPPYLKASQKNTSAKKTKFSQAEIDSIRRTIRFNSVVFDEALCRVPRLNKQFLQRRRSEKLFEKKIVARAFCYRGYGQQKFKDEIELWNEALDLDDDNFHHNPRLKDCWKRLKAIVFENRKSYCGFLGEEEKIPDEEPQITLSNLYKSVSYSVATDTIRKIEDMLRRQHYKKLKRTPEPEMAHLKNIVLNGETLLSPLQYRNLVRAVKETYVFEEASLTEKEAAELYMALLDVLRTRLSKQLRIDKLGGIQILQKIAKLRIPSLRQNKFEKFKENYYEKEEVHKIQYKKKPQFYQPRLFEIEKHGFLSVNQANKKNTPKENIRCIKQQDKDKKESKYEDENVNENENEGQKDEGDILMDPQEQRIEAELVEYFIQCPRLGYVQKQLRSKYGDSAISPLQARYRLQKIIRLCLNVCRRNSEHYAPTVPLMQKFNDEKIRLILNFKETASIRVNLLKMYKSELVNLQQLSKTINQINSYVSKIPYKKCKQHNGSKLTKWKKILLGRRTYLKEEELYQKSQKQHSIQDDASQFSSI